MLFRVLGPLEVELDGVPTVPPGPRPRALLTALLLQPNTVVPGYRLAEAVWGEELPDRVEGALHTTVARLRRALGRAGELIVTRPPGYVLVTNESATDASRFEACYRAARARFADDPATAANLLEEALALWRGPAYGEFADGFARPAATRLQELRLGALEDRAALLLQRGRLEEAVATAGDLAAAQPLRERPVELLMRALHATGRTPEALEAYRRHRALVTGALGLDPSPGLRELEARILRDDVPPPQTADVQVSRAPIRPHLGGLPVRPSRLVGRERELEQLLRLSAARRLVTLTGPGGVGKTRLVLEAAHRLAAEHRLVWWVDLTTVSPERVVDALAEATGVDVQGDTDPAGSLCAALAARRGVLCLDNAEHLLEQLAPVLERLTDAAPGLVVLVTSRERLALDAEAVRALAPLPLPEGADTTNPAVRLFLERVAGLEPTSLAEDDLGLVAEVCRRLDGLPLAIELAAARAAALGLRELAGRLQERLDLLAGGRRTAAQRHRTLRAVVDWSYRLLTDDEARLFARLAVFPGAFSVDQAEAVCSGDSLPRAAIAPLVARLVEQSLLQAGEGRFWLLETLRAYAAERLEAGGEARSLRSRHAHDTAGRLAALDRRLWSADEPAAVAALTELVVDLHAAWEHAADHDPALAVQLAADAYGFAYVRQRLDLLGWGERVAAWQLDHPGLPRALAAAAAAAWAGGRMEAAHEYAARGIAVGGGEGSPRAVLPLTVSADLAMFEGRTDDAVARYRAAVKLYQAAGEPVHALLEEISIGQVLTYAGRAAEARAAIEDLLARAHQTGNPTTLSWAYYIAGEANADAGAERALTAYAAAIEHGSRGDSRLMVTLARSSSIALLARSDDPQRALAQFQQVLDQWERLGNEAAHWWMLLQLVMLLARIDADADAALLAGAVVAARDRYPTLTPDVQRLEAALARVRRRLGPGRTDAILAEGAALTRAATLTRARAAIQAARPRVGPGP
jgi:predicted ATPase/DNA-binding SARP family transcriptional activator